MALDFTKSSEQFLASLDAEIERLRQMREQIAAALGTETQNRSAGRPQRKGMSEEGRRKIAEAQKARWAKQKSTANSAGKRAPAGGTVAKKRVAKKAAAKKASGKAAAKSESAA